MEKIKDTITSIENVCFYDKSFSEQHLQKRFVDPSVTSVLLKDGTDIIGFTYAATLNKNEAHIEDTVIYPKFQGKGLVALLMEKLEKELIRKVYTILIRDSSIENGYADKIEKVYKDQIIEKNDRDSDWGRQRTFKIKLK